MTPVPVEDGEIVETNVSSPNDSEMPTFIPPPNHPFTAGTQYQQWSYPGTSFPAYPPSSYPTNAQNQFAGPAMYNHQQKEYSSSVHHPQHRRTNRSAPMTTQGHQPPSAPYNTSHMSPGANASANGRPFPKTTQEMNNSWSPMHYAPPFLGHALAVPQYAPDIPPPQYIRSSNTNHSITNTEPYHHPRPRQFRNESYNTGNANEMNSSQIRHPIPHNMMPINREKSTSPPHLTPQNPSRMVQPNVHATHARQSLPTASMPMPMPMMNGSMSAPMPNLRPPAPQYDPSNEISHGRNVIHSSAMPIRAHPPPADQPQVSSFPPPPALPRRPIPLPYNQDMRLQRNGSLPAHEYPANSRVQGAFIDPVSHREGEEAFVRNGMEAEHLGGSRRISKKEGRKGNLYTMDKHDASDATFNMLRTHHNIMRDVVPGSNMPADPIDEEGEIQEEDLSPKSSPNFSRSESPYDQEPDRSTQTLIRDENLVNQNRREDMNIHRDQHAEKSEEELQTLARPKSSSSKRAALMLALRKKALLSMHSKKLVKETQAESTEGSPGQHVSSVRVREEVNKVEHQPLREETVEHQPRRGKNEERKLAVVSQDVTVANSRFDFNKNPPLLVEVSLSDVESENAESDYSDEEDEDDDVPMQRKRSRAHVIEELKIRTAQIGRCPSVLDVNIPQPKSTSNQVVVERKQEPTQETSKAVSDASIKTASTEDIPKLDNPLESGKEPLALAKEAAPQRVENITERSPKRSKIKSLEVSNSSPSPSKAQSSNPKSPAQKRAELEMVKRKIKELEAQKRRVLPALSLMNVGNESTIKSQSETGAKSVKGKSTPRRRYFEPETNASSQLSTMKKDDEKKLHPKSPTTPLRTSNSPEGSGTQSDHLKAVKEAQKPSPWNRQENKTRGGQVIVDQANTALVNDLKFEIESQRQSLAMFQDYSKLLQASDFSLAQAAERVSHKRNRATRLQEELKEAEAQALDAEQDYYAIHNAAKRMRTQLVAQDFADSFPMPDISISPYIPYDPNQSSASHGKSDGLDSKSEKDEEESPFKKFTDVILQPSPFSDAPPGSHVSCLKALKT